METSSFRKLPAKLRNKIYELVLPRNDTLKVHSTYAKRGTRGYVVKFLFPGKIINAPLLTCKQTRRDCAEPFYANNTFRINYSGHHTKVAASFADQARAVGGSSVVKELIMVSWPLYFADQLGRGGIKDLLETFRVSSAEMARNARLLGRSKS